MAAVKFRKSLVDLTNRCEACSVADVNGDGIPDIICGEYWYEGPAFTIKHKICDIPYEHEYVWDFSDYPMDVNGNGLPDIITASWWSDGVYWRENPGNNGEWKTHKICDSANVETVRFYDIDGCGTVEIFPNCPGEPAFFLKLVTDAQGRGIGKFEKYVIGVGNAGHGLGAGDIDGDGKMEVLLPGSILKMKNGDPFDCPWEVKPGFAAGGSFGVPILVHDVNGDGIADVIAGEGHNYGLYWFEQSMAASGEVSWTKHVIDGAWSQYHDLQLVDIDGDGELELLTGKRFEAHNGNDPGDSEPCFVCYYKLVKGRFYRYMIEYGHPKDGGSGVGIYFWPADLRGSGRLDIVAPGKEGLYVFYNEGV